MGELSEVNFLAIISDLHDEILEDMYVGEVSQVGGDPLVQVWFDGCCWNLLAFPAVGCCHHELENRSTRSHTTI